MAKKRITRVYTGIGDKGKTALVSGEMVSKSSQRVDSYGDVDELNSVLGICMDKISDSEIAAVINSVQNDLFILGGDLATPDEFEIEVPRITGEMISRLENSIDSYHEEVGDLKEFILPGGSGAGPYLHLARTVCRRAERRVVALSAIEAVNDYAMVYLNRLSDLLFILARVVNKRSGFEETFVDFNKK